MALPSRTAFLSTGLTPLTTANIPKNPASPTSPTDPTECTVCVSTPTSPVRLPCSHTFCKSCITSWLSAPGKNSCAVCRTTLFTLPQNETDDRGNETAQGQDLRTAAATALRTSGLPGLMNGGVGGEAPTAFGAETTPSNLQRATAAGVRFLAAGEREGGGERCKVEKEFLAAYLIAIAYLFPSFATALGRAYEADVRRAWDALVAKVWMVVEGLDGEDLTAAGLEGKLSEAAAGAEGFGEGSGREGDMRALVQFLVLQAQERLRQRQSVKVYKKHHWGIWGKERKGCDVM